ncbi:hypothetical protein [Chroococcidiopsis sp. CCNUC1]|uniref:hypothetical protein n=1 Tax=Chroococcidiopsis sp. CCNUC1 TaxID=2653189 RepID=UPI002022093E|nr:hypothetical protein [Chroococcidiopsis sp. CCNUC1]URD50741.1 hypothetical protein M5J74_01850 [Chroococcidiopsis sp. CCNUC1]
MTNQEWLPQNGEADTYGNAPLEDAPQQNVMRVTEANITRVVDKPVEESNPLYDHISKLSDEEYAKQADAVYQQAFQDRASKQEAGLGHLDDKKVQRLDSVVQNLVGRYGEAYIDFLDDMWTSATQDEDFVDKFLPEYFQEQYPVADEQFLEFSRLRYGISEREVSAYLDYIAARPDKQRELQNRASLQRQQQSLQAQHQQLHDKQNLESQVDPNEYQQLKQEKEYRAYVEQVESKLKNDLWKGISADEYNHRLDQMREAFPYLPPEIQALEHTPQGIDVIWTYLETKRQQLSKPKAPAVPTFERSRGKAQPPGQKPMFTQSEIDSMDMATYEKNIDQIYYAYANGLVQK